MRYPKFLQRSGSIGFIAPSFGCTIEPYRTLFMHAMDKLEDQGYKLVLGPNCFAGCGVGKSNTPEACAEEVNDFFINGHTDIILSMGGGETMVEDLPFIDFDGIAKAEPHWFVGYSDNTNLVFTLPTLCDTAAIYGPHIADLGMDPVHPYVEDAWKLLKGELKWVHNYDSWELESLRDEEHPTVPRNTTEAFCMRTWNPDEAVSIAAECGCAEDCISFEGRLLGGCLDCLVTLAGTPFDRVREFNEKYKDDGVIWFMEACDMHPMAVRRALWQLDNAGWFDNAKGFLIGRPRLYGQEYCGMDHYDAVTGQLGHHGVPILMDLDIGHLPPMMPVISGAYAQVRAAKGRFTMEYDLK